MVFAHRDLKNDFEVNKLAVKISLSELEDLLLFVYDLTTTLEDMLWNGHKPQLGGRPFRGQKYIQASTYELLQTLAGEQSTRRL
jgi:hypothetical protein